MCSWLAVPLRVQRLALFALALVASPTLLRGQETRTVTGAVTDSGGRPIPYVNIDGGPRHRTLTDASGGFTMVLSAREGLDIAVRRIGFLPARLRVEAGGDTTVSVSMQQLAVLMNTQVVRAQQQVRTLETRGFYGRMLDRARGALVGEFITPEEIEMRNPQRPTQLLEQRPGISIRRLGNCQVIVKCWAVLGTGGCIATVYLDGQRLNPLGAATNERPNWENTPAIDELIPVSGISAVEVYPRGASAPPKYQGLSGTCAVVLIWTR